MTTIDRAVHYLSVSKGTRVLYEQTTGSDREVDRLAALCLENAPPFHARYFHTASNRTFAFLMSDDHVYFTITDARLSNPEILKLLTHLRELFVRPPPWRGKSVDEELVPVIQRLITSLESVPRIGCEDRTADGGQESVNGSTDGAPLLGRPSKNERKKMKDRGVDAREGGSDERTVRIDVDHESHGANSGVSGGGGSGAVISLQKSSSSNRVRAQQGARRVWWRQVRIIVAIDVVVCLLLFGVWLAVCKGFRCVSG
ncbi:putative VAMP-like protein [Acorus gramineus]|uniref:VAMP-like protein n=1 Tax=Acorus gramineus TaxID=55184 RepID=A0AAV9BIN4_ACOGR|nr:putative VAMP-like protein [Acorus gramineus]